MGKRLTPEETEAKAELDEARAQKRRMQAKLSKLDAILDANPFIVDDVIKKAESLAGAKIGGASAEPAEPQAPVSSEPRDILSETIDRLHYRLDLLPIKQLKAILFFYNPIRFTPHALKACMKRGQKEIAKQSCGEILEYVAGMTLETEIGRGFYVSVRDLAVHIKTTGESIPGGHQRAALLPLPPSWPTDGSYLVIDRGAEALVLKFRFGDETIQLQQGDHGFRWSGAGDTVEIEKNFSDSGAYLKDAMIAQAPLNLFALFQAAKAVAEASSPAKPASKKKPLALEDGQPTSSPARPPKAQKAGVKETLAQFLKKKSSPSEGSGASDAKRPLALTDRAETDPYGPPVAAVEAPAPKRRQRKKADADFKPPGRK
eukprot:TRINITY_DN30522_c0_g1_i1.p1 TRINITY_DN30522_c0_g1~~TRINITY_DN30522_c0_g1_i1.p1  ORF type:complete len:397 (+),score=98.12 TRINITY_DN30522_c0_g1_i1:71-1192(+)